MDIFWRAFCNLWKLLIHTALCPLKLLLTNVCVCVCVEGSWNNSQTIQIGLNHWSKLGKLHWTHIENFIKLPMEIIVYAIFMKIYSNSYYRIYVCKWFQHQSYTECFEIHGAAKCLLFCYFMLSLCRSKIGHSSFFTVPSLCFELILMTPIHQWITQHANLIKYIFLEFRLIELMQFCYIPFRYITFGIYHYEIKQWWK